MVPQLAAQRCIPIVVSFIALTVSAWSATFPLPIPQRPTTFPLSRPQQKGQLVAWGRFSNALMPSGLNDIVAFSPGFGTSSLALHADGTIVQFDATSSGSIQAAPPDATNIVAVAQGNRHAAALRADGTVIVWGENFYGQLNVPSGLSNVVSISCSFYYTVAIKADGRAVGWGSYDQIGVFVELPASFNDLVAVSCSPYCTFGLKSDGTVVFWAGVPSDLPGPPAGLTDIVSLASTAYHALALKRDGTVIAWGRSTEGELAIPSGLSNVVAISADYTYNLALKDSGFLTFWGDQGSSTYAPPSNLQKVFAVNDTMALTAETPPYLPRVSIAISRINVVMEVVPGYKYQLETSNDLIHFTAVGTPFVADKSSVTQEFPVTEVGQYFRMQEVP
jgi:hypothetical protein